MNLNEIQNIRHTGSGNFFLIAGPCAIEGESMAMKIAEEIMRLSEEYAVPFIFKGSFKKANRSRLDSFTGIGDKKALSILAKVRETFHIPVLTDIHKESDALLAAEYVDVLQIPAFLARQTDLLTAAAQTGKTVNIKKGQFMSPEIMRFAVEKITAHANDKVMLTERGTMFGYGDLVVDFRSIPIMKKFATTVLDITHSLQRPNSESGVTGGNPEWISTIARAGIAVGADGIFLETHYNPAEAKSDAANMLKLSYLEPLLQELIALRKALPQDNE